MANKSNKKQSEAKALATKSNVFFKPSNLQGVLKYVIAGLGLIMLMSLFLGVVKVTSSTDEIANFPGYALAFGSGYEVSILDIAKIDSSFALIITYVLIIAASFTVLMDFENEEWVKRLILPVIFLFTAISFLQIPENFVNASGTAGTVAFSVVGIIFAIIAWLQVALSTVLIVLDRVNGNKQVEAKQFEITKYIIAGCSFVAIIGLFFGVGKISSASALQAFTGSQLAFGTSLDASVLSISTLPANGLIIASYVAIVVAVCLTLLPIPEFNGIKQWLIIVLFLFATFYFWKIPSFAFANASSTAYKSLTAYGNLAAVATTAALIFSVGNMALQNDRDTTFKFIIAAIGLFAATTLFLPIAGGKMVYSGYTYSQSEFTGWELIFKKTTYASSGTKPIFAIIAYITTILGSIGLVITAGPKKIRYLVSAVLFLASVIFFLLIPVKTFIATQGSTNYFGFLAESGIIAVVLVGIATVVSLYLAAITPTEE